MLDAWGIGACAAFDNQNGGLELLAGQGSIRLQACISEVCDVTMLHAWRTSEKSTAGNCFL